MIEGGNIHHTQSFLTISHEFGDVIVFDHLVIKHPEDN